MGDRSFFRAKGFEFSQAGFADRAIAALTAKHVKGFSLEEPQLYAWREELRFLKPIALAHPESTIAFEYMIPRMGRRVDAVILIDRAVFIVEFKVGESGYPAVAADQLRDYIFDLKNFHMLSHDRVMVPILVCTGAKAIQPKLFGEIQQEVLRSNGANLLEMIDDAIESNLFSDTPLDHEAWLNALYSPTPTIIEAAQALYQSNQVEDISRSEAGVTNISETTECVNEIIRHSKANNRKSICFVTGVPGAGKTLVGLNIASKRRAANIADGEELAVFLSGNGPLIEVLQASLVEDQQARYKEECAACKLVNAKPDCKGCVCKKTKREIQGEVKSFVQGVHLFREEYFVTDQPPAEHIAIFDESQRAWTADQLSFKMRTRWQNKRDVYMSEPHVLIEYLNRHKDWATIVCLVGGGQEINQGEAGIIEWFRALSEFHPDWDVYVSDQIENDVYLGADKLHDVVIAPNIISSLHLSVDMRSFRNKNVAAFAEALVDNKPEEARALYQQISKDYPIYVTRDLNGAKDWVRNETKRPSDRYGIVADSYGQRIRADGIIVPTLDFDAVKWFLRGKDEIDSSYYMEIAASEFKIQGLEIDYAVVAWEGDFRYRGNQFEYHRFYGGKWQNVHAEMSRRYLKNGYRVLLTRARQGFVIYVPKGNAMDPTRPPEFYDETYQYLIGCGVEELKL